MISFNFYEKANYIQVKQWQMQEAKAKLSEVIQKACKEGPQEISVRGQRSNISAETEYQSNRIV